MTNNSPHPRDDVVVLGSGLTGTTAALCLQRQGLRVTIVDKDVHPRFALGEATTTPSSLWLRLLAERFDVPELLDIASHEALCRRVGVTSGVKNNFGFLYHGEGAAMPVRRWQAVIATAALSDATPPPGGEMHYFRQDVDAYLWRCAADAGVRCLSSAAVTDVACDADGVTIAIDGRAPLRASFVIDASGHRSPLASRFVLRDAEPRCRTNSRTRFTHMTGVPPFDRIDAGPPSISPWHQGTLHHFFDGGWIWVIPFDNHPRSSNGRCSVGLMLDNHRLPASGADAEEDWRRVLARYPAIAAHLGDARPVRPWNAAPRVQYTSSSCVGDRYWIAPHATFAIDALYSMGNIHAFQTIAAAVPQIVASCRDGDFRAERLAGVQRLTDNLLRFQDRIVFGSYASLRSPELLEIWIALWALTDTARIRELLIPMVRRARTGRLEELAFYERAPEQVFTGLGHCTGVESTEALLDRLDGFCDVMVELQQGRAGVAETAARLRRELHGVAPYHVDLDLMRNALGTFPWTYAPLAQHGLRAYSATFLTDHELGTLGVEGGGPQ